MAQATTDEEKADLLIRKYHFLQRLPGCGSYVEKVVAEIYQVDPQNLEYRLKHINSLFEKQSIWPALTEYMRFEADAQFQLHEAEVSNKDKHDTHAQTKKNMLLSELE